MSALPWCPDLTGRQGPKYLAIVQGIRSDLESGVLAPGMRLPPQRDLARALGVDLTTVTRAFNEARRLGLIEAAGARGSYVRGTPAADAPPERSPGAIADFSMNMPPQPADALLRQRILAGLADVLGGSDGLARLHYQASIGLPADRAVAARWLEPRLGPVAADRVAIAPGAQMVLFAVLKILAAPGDAVCTTALTYPGLRAAAAQLRVRLVPVATDGDGMIPTALAEACGTAMPKAIYCVPTMDNPTAVTMPEHRRREIADVARRFSVPVIEDDAYGALASSPIVAIGSLVPALTWHVSTLSKCLSPALRIAFVAAPGGSEMTRLSAELRASSLMAAPLMAALAVRWIEDGTAAAVTAAIREEGRSRQAIARRQLAGFDLAAHPDGYHVWLELPEPWRHGAFEADARQLGLAVVTDRAFAVAEAPRGLRIALGAASDRVTMEHGLALLARLLREGPGAGPTVV